MIRRALFGAGLAAVLATPLAAQQADKTRLDEFALPQASSGAGVEQLRASEVDPVGAGPVATDRELAVPGPQAAPRAPVPQLSQTGQSSVSPQLSDPALSRRTDPGSLSSSAESRPGAVARLAGNDRCDPQQPAEQLAQCERILERRASEFQAAEAPRMSAEQALLAAQDERRSPLSEGTVTRLARGAGGSPNPEDQDNQELASILLATRDGAPSQDERAPEARLPEGLAEILGGLGIVVVPNAP